MNRFFLTVVSCLALSAVFGPGASADDQETAPSPQASSQSTDQKVNPGNGGYPRVTELEQEFLGKTYVDEPLSQRVARLEVKKFGKPSSGDFCDRIDKLDQLSARKPVAPDDDVVTYSDSAGGEPAATSTGSNQAGQTAYAPSDYGSYPRVSEIEKQFLGKTYESDPLQVRVARLETKEYGKTFPDEALSDRVDRLDKKANPRGDRGETANAGSGDGSTSHGGGAMGGLGKALVNILGSTVGGGPGMFGGLGPGMYSRGGGFNQRQPQPVATAPSPPVNPFGPEAPPVSGLENRAGVMEKFVFGREHAELPIDERVKRLEKRLVPWEHNETSADINFRIDHLWKILAAANAPKRDVADSASDSVK